MSNTYDDWKSPRAHISAQNVVENALVKNFVVFFVSPSLLSCRLHLDRNAALNRDQRHQCVCGEFTVTYKQQIAFQYYRSIIGERHPSRYLPDLALNGMAVQCRDQNVAECSSAPSLSRPMPTAHQSSI